MATIIAVLGGIGLFLLGMSVMTDGLKALAGSSLRTVLGKAAATPLSGAFWGAIVTLLAQSSSAVTMTTIGLVSAGLLTFPQGLGLVFGANVGTTGTAWLIALVGVRVSLSSYALPMIFVGALTKLLAGGRIAAGGAALAGFALVLYGLTTLQQGMGGLAQSLHPSDLPAVLGTPGVGWFAGSIGLLKLLVAGLAMTAVMQSSTASIAVTIAAFYAGAVGLEQGAALIIGQNIGTATSSALAAIGASATAKRLALAYVLFKVIAALIAIVAFPFTLALMTRLATTIDGTTLLAAYHTAYNVVGVAVLLPATNWFTRVVERLLPSQESAIDCVLDRAALANPVVAIEAARRSVADALRKMAIAIVASLSGEKGISEVDVANTNSDLQKVRDFLSGLEQPPCTETERSRLTSILHALDHATRLAEILEEGGLPSPPADTDEDMHVANLCKSVLRWALTVDETIVREATLSDHSESIGWNVSTEVEKALSEVAQAANALDAATRDRRAAILASVASGRLNATEAFARVDAERRLGRIANNTWRATAHLLGIAGPAMESRYPTDANAP